jgi:hypothetical protein
VVAVIVGEIVVPQEKTDPEEDIELLNDGVTITVPV